MEFRGLKGIVVLRGTKVTAELKVIADIEVTKVTKDL